MLSFFRRLSSSKIGTIIVATFFILVLVGFALGDLQNFGSGNLGFGMGSSTLARVGDQSVSEKDMSDAMQRRLQQVRQERTDADYSSIMGDFSTILDELIDSKTLISFADKFGFPLSKRLIDAEIAQIPQTRGLNGQFSEQAYRGFLAQQRLTDDQVREILAGGLLQRLMLTPIAGNARVSVRMATPYASMLLESRDGEAAAFPVGAFRAGLEPSDAEIQQYYAANRNRYMVPEQRVLRVARIGPDQVSNVAASDQEVAAYYNSNKAAYAAQDLRSISQAVVQDQATADAIAARAKGGAAIAAASAPAGGNAAVTSLADQTRDAYAGVAGNQPAAAVFAASQGAVVGPVKSDFGWIVAKVESVKTKPGKSLAEATPEIAAKLNVDKRKEAIEDIVDKVQDAVDQGSNFAEAAAAAKLPVIATPLLTATGTSRADPSYKLPAELAPVLKAGFEIESSDPPEIVTLPNGQGYAMVSPAQTDAAAPAPLASVREQVANDWIDGKAAERARAAATQAQAKIEHGASLAEAVKSVTGVQVQALKSRRIQVAMAQGPVPAPLKMLFTLGEGKSRMIPDPKGRGFFIVKVDKIVPGDAILQPSLIGQVQSELQQSVSDEYARQFLAAIREQMNAKRNESAIQSMKARMATSGG